QDDASALRSHPVRHLTCAGRNLVGVSGIDRPPPDRGPPAADRPISGERHFAVGWTEHSVRLNPPGKPFIPGIDVGDGFPGQRLPRVKVLVRMAADVMTFSNDAID